MNVLSYNENKFLIVSILGIVVIFIIGNFLNQENYPLFDDFYSIDILFVIIPIIVIILGIILSVIYRGSGDHGKAWILFTISILIWFVGETTFQYDYEYDIEDISTLTSDIFYILGYPVFFAFTILYLRPRKNVISKNMILAAILVSITFVLPTLYLTFEGEEELDSLTMFFYAIYPILGGLILTPSIIAVILFFRGEVNFLWILVLVATLSDILADTLYIVFALDDLYYPGHPIDILYLSSYIFYAFGAYSHIKLFGNLSKQK